MKNNTYMISNGRIWNLVIGVYVISQKEAICEFVLKAHRGRRLHADSGPSYDRICAHLCYLSLYQRNEERKEEESAGSALCTPEYMHINTHMHDDMSNFSVIKWSMLWCRMDLIAAICPLL